MYFLVAEAEKEDYKRLMLINLHWGKTVLKVIKFLGSYSHGLVLEDLRLKITLWYNIFRFVQNICT